jgi:ADP-ribose pyrophosphatase
MALPGRTLAPAELDDRPELWPAAEVARLDGRLTSFVREDVTTPAGGVIRRDWLRHPGAVAVIAVDGAERLAVVVQYRHPAGFRLVEPPAGLFDRPGEDPLAAAQRELAEEVRLQAADWKVLADLFTSPGASQESIRVFLARGLAPAAPPAGFELEGEEAEMGVGWAAVDDVVAAILAGRLQSPTLIAGVLAYWAARQQGRLDGLRPPDAPWPGRAAKLSRDGT